MVATSGDIVDIQSNPCASPQLNPSTIFTISGTGNVPIMEMSAQGEITIFDRERMGEAGDVFVDFIQRSMDTAAGFENNRLQWEEDYMAELRDRATIAPLTADDIHNLFQSRKVFDRLKR